MAPYFIAGLFFFLSLSLPFTLFTFFHEDGVVHGRNERGKGSQGRKGKKV